MDTVGFSTLSEPVLELNCSKLCEEICIEAGWLDGISIIVEQYLIRACQRTVVVGHLAVRRRLSSYWLDQLLPELLSDQTEKKRKNAYLVTANRLAGRLVITNCFIFIRAHNTNQQQTSRVNVCKEETALLL